MKHLITIILSLALYTLSAQESTTIAESPINKMQPQIKLEMGSYYSSAGQYGSLFGTYIAPHISIPVNERLRINTGINLVYNQFTENPENESLAIWAPPSSVYIEGEYLLNPNLIISGTVYKEFTLNPLTPGGEQLNPRAFNYEREGFIIGAEYRINNNMFIEARFEMSRGDTPPIFPYGTASPGFFNSSSPFHNSFFMTR